MWELNLDNINEYIEGILNKVPVWRGRSLTAVKCEEVKEETYVNYIFRVTLQLNGQESIVYLRQTRDHLKSSPQRKLDPARMVFESRFLTLLNNIASDVVPEVLYLDGANNIAVLTDIKRDGVLLVNELLKGKPHPETGAYFGSILATYHRETLNIDHSLVHGSEAENEKALKFHEGMRMEPAEKMFPSLTSSLLAESRKAEKCLVLGDLTSKNIFVDEEKVRFLDLERAFVGDPAFDLGYLLAHYLTEVKPECLKESVKFTGNFMESYRQVMRAAIGEDAMAKLENRAIRFLGAMILFRFFGLYFVVKIERDTGYWAKIARSLLSDTEATRLSDLLPSLLGLQDQVLRSPK